MPLAVANTVAVSVVTPSSTSDVTRSSSTPLDPRLSFFSFSPGRLPTSR